jgi:hypothetical protein
MRPKTKEEIFSSFNIKYTKTEMPWNKRPLKLIRIITLFTSIFLSITAILMPMARSLYCSMESEARKTSQLIGPPKLIF